MNLLVMPTQGDQDEYKYRGYLYSSWMLFLPCRVELDNKYPLNLNHLPGVNKYRTLTTPVGWYGIACSKESNFAVKYSLQVFFS